MAALLLATLATTISSSISGAVTISVDPAATGSCSGSSGAASFRCKDLHAAPAKAEQLTNQDVVVSFGDVQRDGPCSVKAPYAGAGTLQLRGLKGAALDGGGRRTLLAVTHGTALVKGVAFQHGWVNATDQSWYRAVGNRGTGGPVSVLAHGTTFTDGTFEGNCGVDGGALLAEGGTTTLRRCHFTDNQGYGGGDGGAHDTGGGGAVMLVHGRLEIQDSVFDNNVATDPPGTPNQKGRRPGHPPPRGGAGARPHRHPPRGR
jgi:hypothetical protein